jgi:hypothetical protein
MQFLASARRSGSSRWIHCVCLAAAALGATSCATTAGGGSQTRLLVTTEPPGVTLYVNGANMGPTPARIDVMPGESSMALRLACDGYQDAEVTVTRRMHGRLETSLPLEGEPIDRQRSTSAGSAIGSAVVAAAVTVIDRRTGSAGRLYPSAVHVVLVKK